MIKYENFIIDLGGVLYKIDESNAVNAFKVLSQLTEQEFFAKMETVEFKNIIADYEKGTSSTKQFYDLMTEIFEMKCTMEDFKRAWNSTLYYFFDDAIENIKMLKAKGNVVLLSNTNELHYERFEPESRDILPLFDAYFFSFQIGMRKPDYEIFRYVLEKMKFDINKTIFIDDSHVNIESARRLGLNVFHVKKEGLSEFIKYLNDFSKE